MRKKRGKFIAISGGEGTGKSTQVRIVGELLRRALAQQSIGLVVIKQPGATEEGAKIRERLLHQEHSWDEELSLFLEDGKLTHEQIVLPALERGDWVLSDREAADRIAYQGYGRRIKPEYIERLHRDALWYTPPDLYILLDMQPEEALKRILEKQREGEPMTRFDLERLDFHQDVRHGFLTQLEKYPELFVKIDAAQSPGKVTEAIWQALRQKFPELPEFSSFGTL